MEIIQEFYNEVFSWNIFCGIIAAIVVFVIEIRFFSKKGRTNKRIETAKILGHTVDAKRIKAWDDDTSGYSVDSWFHASYEYSVDGKVYKYKYLSKVSPPLVLKLYYKNNPARAFSENEKTQQPLAILIYLVPIAVAIIVVNLLGGI